MAKEINALELRKHFGEIIDEVGFKRETYIVTKNNRPMMVLLDMESYEAFQKGEGSPQATGVLAAPSAPHPEETFIEEYSKERIDEFLKADKPEKA